MKLSTKCRYGARAVLEIAKQYKKTPIKRKDIVKTQDISDSYLENILITLKNTGIIDTIRGANGGYMLMRAPDKITMLEIVNSLEGSLSPVGCLDNPMSCDRIDTCSTRKVWRKLKDAKEEVLRSFTIQMLMDDEKHINMDDMTCQ